MILDVLKAMGRRWYIVLIGLALTVGLTWFAYQSTPPEYKARSLLLLLPGENAVAEGGNPFLALSGLEQPASIVVAYFACTVARAEVEEVSDTADFSVQLDASTRGPVIAVEVTDRSSAATLETLSFLSERVPQELQRLQEGVDAPAASVITSMSLTADTEPEVDSSGTIRISLAALGIGIVVTGIATFAIDGLLNRRRLRRGSSTTKVDEPSMDDASVADKIVKTRYVRAAATPEHDADTQLRPPKTVDRPVRARAGRGS